MPQSKERREELRNDPEWRARKAETQQRYRERHPDRKPTAEKVSEYNARWRAKQDPDELRAYHAEKSRERAQRLADNPEWKEDRRQQSAAWHEAHKDDPEYREYKRQKGQESYHRDIGHSRELGRQSAVRRRAVPRKRLRLNVSHLVYDKLRKRLSGKDGKSSFKILPYTVDELMVHLESKFESGMTWDNYGEWHIDHVLPDASFVYRNVGDPGFLQSWALDNLQPLWASDNFKKGSRTPGRGRARIRTAHPMLSEVDAD